MKHGERAAETLSWRRSASETLRRLLASDPVGPSESRPAAS